LGPLPETYYFNGTLDFGYRFDYTNRDVDIYMVGNDLQSVSQNYKSGHSNCDCARKLHKSINKKSYADVITALNLKDSQLRK
jgi:hypothetical protein